MAAAGLLYRLFRRSREIVADDGIRALVGQLPRGVNKIRYEVIDGRSEREWGYAAKSADAHRAGGYATVDADSQYVGAVLSEWAAMDGSILEVGCNAGSHLEYLRQAGWDNLSGLDISPTAIDLAAVAFPDLATTADLKCGAAQDLLPKVDDRRYDVVFSVSTLWVVESAQECLLDEIARVCHRTIVIVEMEPQDVPSLPFNFETYESEFERRGFEQVAATPVAEDPRSDGVSDSLSEHTLRVFRRGQ